MRQRFDVSGKEVISGGVGQDARHPFSQAVRPFPVYFSLFNPALNSIAILHCYVRNILFQLARGASCIPAKA